MVKLSVMITKSDKPFKKAVKGRVPGTIANFENDPLVIKKNAAAKAVIEKYGFPKEFALLRKMNP